MHMRIFRGNFEDLDLYSSRTLLNLAKILKFPATILKVPATIEDPTTTCATILDFLQRLSRILVQDLVQDPERFYRILSRIVSNTIRTIAVKEPG